MPPDEQPFQYDKREGVPYWAAMIALACTVISWTARYAKSVSFSGWPSAKLPLPPEWPVSVEAVA